MSTETIKDYLASPQAVEDVKALLASDVIENATDEQRMVFVGDGPGAEFWTSAKFNAWTVVGWCDDLQCYYRPEGELFAVSDCGETIGETMRRSGCTWDQAVRRVRQELRDVPVPVLPDLAWRAVPADRLAEYIVTTLGAIQKCRESLP